jgi:catechol 2,3-dioxygenase-like lactoylglutathione lyase family enzyme
MEDGTIRTLGIHHYAIGVADLDRSVSWYGRVLGFRLERRFGFPKLGTAIAHILHPTGVRIELLERSGSTPGPDVEADPFGALLVRRAKHIGLLVADVDATWERLQALGVDLVAPPTNVEPAGVRNCWIRDPDGTLIKFPQWL